MDQLLYPTITSFHYQLSKIVPGFRFQLSEIGKITHDGEEIILSKIRDIQRVLIKPILTFNEATTDTERDSIGNAPVNLGLAWITDDYLTVSFNFWADIYNSYF